MASGKLSPRQRMINMMYLVLTAMLALNVSKEVLDAFTIIKKQLNLAAANTAKSAESEISGMKKLVQDEIDNRGITKNKGLPDTLDLVKAETDKMISYLNTHITELESIAKPDPETGLYGRPEETELNYQYWFGIGRADLANDGRGNGKAIELRNEIEKYYGFLHEIKVKNTTDPQARAQLKPKTVTPTYSDKEGTRSWERYHLNGPVAGNLAILEAFKADIFDAQNEVLNLLAGRLGKVDFVFNDVTYIDAPVSRIVPAGMNFETQLAVGAISTTLNPSFSSPSGSIKTEGGKATLTVAASAGVIPSGKSEGKQRYTALIRVPKATGGFTDLPISGEFTVRKPEIVVSSAAIQNLYRDCANDINIDVPALGDLYNPQVTASSGQVITSQKSKREFRVIPTGKKCVVTVNNAIGGKNTKIGDLSYNVIAPPKPTIDMAVNGTRNTGTIPVPKNSRVSLRLVPDEDFKSLLPKDANYEITSVVIKAQLSLGPPETVGTQNLAGQDATKAVTFSLGQRVQQAPGNTKVYIEIEKVNRINFQGKKVEVPMGQQEKTLSLVVK